METKTELDNQHYDLAPDVLEAIADRYTVLRPTFPTGETDDRGGFIYSGKRGTEPATIVFYFGRKVGARPFDHHNIAGISAESVKAGKFDHVITDCFYDRAASDYWYTYCKDYGVDID
jgi:hypothetical protein